MRICEILEDFTTAMQNHRKQTAMQTTYQSSYAELNNRRKQLLTRVHGNEDAEALQEMRIVEQQMQDTKQQFELGKGYIQQYHNEIKTLRRAYKEQFIIFPGDDRQFYNTLGFDPIIVGLERPDKGLFLAADKSKFDIDFNEIVDLEIIGMINATYLDNVRHYYGLPFTRGN